MTAGPWCWSCPPTTPLAGFPIPMGRILAASPAPVAGAVVVDDGSAAAAYPVFAAVDTIPNVVVLRRPANGGRGAALKDGFRAAIDRWPAGDRHDHRRCGRPARSQRRGPRGAHADRASRITWCSACAASTVRCPGAVALATRRLGPWCSSLPAGASPIRRPDCAAGREPMAQNSLQLGSSGYDFELDALLAFRAAPRIEVPIATIYRDENRHSHFRPVRDSLWIARVMWRHWRNRSSGGAVPSARLIQEAAAVLRGPGRVEQISLDIAARAAQA